MEDNSKKIRLRTIPNALKEIKKDDPDTSITYCALKKLCDNGLIRTIKVGNRVLINYDELLTILNV